MRIRLLLVAVAALGLTACGSTSAEPLPTSATAPAVESLLPVATTLPPASEPLVEFEADWLCQVQRFAFVDLSEIETQHQQALDGAGFTSAEYAAFEVRLEEDGDLRTEVKERYLAECDASEPAVEDADA